MKISCLIATLALLILCLVAFPSESGTINVPEKIKVVVSDNVVSLKLSVRGKYKIETTDKESLLKEGDTFFNLEVTPAEHGIRLGKDYLKVYGLQIMPEKEPAIYIGERLYRGTLQIIKTKEGRLNAVNIVDLEDYIKGVLYHEVSQKWPIEAIRAQAIVSRTFALYQAEQNKSSDYYLKADTSSQVYGGVYAEKYRTNKATDGTRAEVLTFNGAILPAFFHATCAGATEDSGRLWKVTMRPLVGVKCNFCKNSPHFSWEYRIGLNEIEERLNKAGYKLSGITYIDTIGRDSSGRAIKLLIKDKRKSIKISSKDFRQIVGTGLLKSTKFSVYVKGRSAVFKGKGWGHGVGMCQWGAFAMAKKGMTAEEIVKYYYPGAEVVRYEA